MKTFTLIVESTIKEEVEVIADNYDKAIDAYYDGEYDKCEELQRQVLKISEK